MAINLKESTKVSMELGYMIATILFMVGTVSSGVYAYSTLTSEVRNTKTQVTAIKAKVDSHIDSYQTMNKTVILAEQQATNNGETLKEMKDDIKYLIRKADKRDSK